MKEERFCIEKRTLQVLQCNYNDVMRWYIWAVEAIKVTVVVFGLCGSVWVEGVQAVRLSLVALFALVLLIKLGKGFGAV